MRPANFRHIGGAIIADHGRVTLAAARASALFYAMEAGSETRAASGECQRRSHALKCAIDAASLWRRAAGWNDPDLADHPAFERT